MAGGLNTLDGKAPVIIAHRGASGYLPEHTLAAYALAIEMGADFIEPDLVITSDGHLVARHENYLSTSTNVADLAEFADRRRENPAFSRTDWWVEDFTLAEVKALHARQAFPGRSAENDGLHEIPTFEEILWLVSESSAVGRHVGVYPETKNPGYFRDLGLDFQAPLLQALEAHGLLGAAKDVFIQSFEPWMLQELRLKTDTRLVMLTYSRAVDEPGAPPAEPHVALEEMTGYADAVGPYKRLLIDGEGRDTGLVARAHQLGLLVHPWTFRSDALEAPFTSPEAEYAAYFALGVDGLFSDFSDQAVVARKMFLAGAR
jgi:glycerophosphoryl diester phosphodiesterase